MAPTWRPIPIMAPNPPFLKLSEVAEYLCTDVEWVRRLVADRLMPLPVRLGGHLVWTNLAIGSWYAWQEVCPDERFVLKQARGYDPNEYVSVPNPSIYFARHEGYVKIGYATNVKRRLASLQTSCPAKLELLLVIPGSMDDERSMHRRFAEHRVRPDGEWFYLRPEITEFIAASVAAKV